MTSRPDAAGRHVTACALLVVLAFTAAACAESPAEYDVAATTTAASTSASTSTQPALGSNTASIDVLEKAIAKTQSVSSGHIAVSSEFSASGGVGVGVGTDDDSDPESGSAPEGWTTFEEHPSTTMASDWMETHQNPGEPGEGSAWSFDRAKGRASMDVALFGYFNQVIVDGDQSYLQLQEPANSDAPWVAVPTKDLDGIMRLYVGGVDLIDPMEMLQDIVLIGPTATKVGTEQLDGTSMTRYRARMNLSALNAKRLVIDPKAPVTYLATESPGADDVPVDLWIDKAGVVRRFWYVASYEVTTSFRVKSDPDGQPKTSKGHSEVAFDLVLTRPGKSVSITIPKPNQITPAPPGGFEIDATG